MGPGQQLLQTETTFFKTFISLQGPLGLLLSKAGLCTSCSLPLDYPIPEDFKTVSSLVPKHGEASLHHLGRQTPPPLWTGRRGQSQALPSAA